jgi:tetratricopeptide (TPR) repeat protein
MPRHSILALAAILALTPSCMGQQSSGPAGESGQEAAAATQPAQEPASRAEAEQDATRRIEELRAALQRNPADQRTKQLLAIALLDFEEKEEALALFKELADGNPSTGNLLNLAKAYSQSSLFTEAEQAYRRVLAQTPTQPNALHGLGNLAFKMARTEEAQQYYKQAIAARPNYLLAYLHLGQAQKDAGQFEEAYATWGRIMEFEPSTREEVESYLDALYEMAALDVTMGRHERAVMLLEELIAIHPNHEKANYAYGQALMYLGREEEAQAAFDAHMKILAAKTPDSPMAHGDR